MRGIGMVLTGLLFLTACPGTPPGAPLKVIATETWSFQDGGTGYFILTKYEDNSVKVTGGCVTNTNTGTNIICNITAGTATLSNTAYWEFSLDGTSVNYTPTLQFGQGLGYGYVTNGYVSGSSYLAGFNDGSSMYFFSGISWTGQRISGSNITSNF